MNKTIKAWTEKADNILEAADKQLQEIDTKLKQEQAKAGEYKAAMEKAEKAADPDAYKVAKENFTDADVAVTMYLNRIKTLESGQLVSEDEYNKAVSEIMDTLADEDRQAREKIIALADEIKQIEDQFAAMVDEGNAILHKWQYDIYKDERVYKALRSTNAAKIYGCWDQKWKDTGTIALSYQALERLDLLRR